MLIRAVRHRRRARAFFPIKSAQLLQHRFMGKIPHGNWRGRKRPCPRNNPTARTRGSLRATTGRRKQQRRQEASAEERKERDALHDGLDRMAGNDKGMDR